MNTHKLKIVLFSALGLVGCATAEYQAVHSNCNTTWWSKIPPRYEQEAYNQMRSRQVPTGQTVCSSFGYTVTCNQTMRTEFYTVPAVRTVDRNKASRDSKISSCTYNTCIQRFGNDKCK